MLAFVHIEKCGGTTLLHSLRRAFGVDHFDVMPRDKSSMLFGPDDMRALLALRSGARSIAGHTVRPRSNLESVVPDVRYYTLLRDPVARYVSDFRHFVDLLGFPDDFELWLGREDRRDFQTRAIAGTDDVEEAKRVLKERLALVGVVEEYADFLGKLRALAEPHHLSADYEVRNRASQRKSRRKPLELERFRERILEQNRLDLELYEYARSVVIPGQSLRFRGRLAEGAPEAPGASARVRERLRAWTNRAYRNLIYKPYMGYAPFKTHALPPYRGFDKRNR
jgi:hypothetical protein